MAMDTFDECTAAGFTQVCVWPGTVVGANEVEAFCQFFKENFNARVRYLEEVETLPDTKNGRPVSDTGGRNDLFFAMHEDDVSRFAPTRLRTDIKWLEDALDSWGELYPPHIHKYRR